MRGDVRQLLEELSDRVGDDFVDRVRVLAEPLEQALQERSINERSNDRRKLLIGLREKVVAGWDEFTRVFNESIRREMDVRAGWAPEDDGESELTVSSLQLVGDEEVEWDLALTGAVSRMKAAGGEALSQFEQRLKGLLGKAGDGSEIPLPVGVDAAGVALKRAIEHLVSETAERRAILVYIEPLLTREMAALFAGANDYLAGRGVELPKSARSGGGRSSGAPGGAHGGGGDPATDSADSPGDILSLLQRFVQTTTGGAATGPGGGGQAAAVGGGAAGGFVALPPAMFESLERMQALDLQHLQEASAGEAKPGGNVLRELRQQDFARQLPPMEAATIDIVAMLFDFIFDDQLVPDAVKALVGRLQIPMLKVAMLDKSFFSNREHPARSLVDTISRISIAAGKGLDHGHPVFERIKAAVNQVLTQFEKDQGIFATLLEEMKMLLAEQERLSNELAEKSKCVAEQQEQQDIAGTQAAEAFERVLKQSGSEVIPERIREFLAWHWTTVLKFAFLKGGVAGHPWSLAIQTLTDLLWSLTPKKGLEERQRLIGMLPELLRRVNAYLDRIGVTAEEKTPFLDALVEIHFGAMKGIRRSSGTKGERKAEGKAPDPTAKSDAAAKQESRPRDSGGAGHESRAEAVSSAELGPTVVVTRVVQEDGVEIETMAVAGKISASRPVRLHEVGKLERGDWVEFRQEDGSMVRGRLSWVSPQRGIMLFTNQQSSKAISISPEALALQMKRGLAVRLTDAAEPLVDRALGRAMHSLKVA